MQTENLSEILRQHPFLAGLSDAHMEVLTGCASNVRYAEGAPVIQEGEIANTFYLIRTGRIALETDVNARGKIRIQTVGPGDVLGWSWLISPFRWHFNALAVAGFFERRDRRDAARLRRTVRAHAERRGARAAVFRPVGG